MKAIRMVSAAYFLIPELEAFDGRWLSTESWIEDIIAVLDGRSEIIDEIPRAEASLGDALTELFKKLLQDAKFVAVSGHMPTGETSQARVSIILNTMRSIIGIHWANKNLIPA